MSLINKKYFLCIFIVCLFQGSLFAYEMNSCISCHSDNRDPDIPQISIKEYNSSIHGSTMSCLECHSYIEEEHEAGGVKEKVNCNNCHQQENMHGASANGETRPECYSCHTKHSILPSHLEKSSVNEAHFKETCSRCHETQYGKNGYLNEYLFIRIRSHKKEDFSRDFNEQNCTGCHQGMAIHGTPEKVSDDDCAKCHIKDNKNAMMGRFHATANSGLSIKRIILITQIVTLGILIFFIRFAIKTSRKQGRGGK